MPETKTICAPLLKWSPGAVTYACVLLRQRQQSRDNRMVYFVWERDFRCSLPLTLTRPLARVWPQRNPEVPGATRESRRVLRVERETVVLPWEMEDIWRQQTDASLYLQNQQS